jgi:hypothetical protein
MEFSGMTVRYNEASTYCILYGHKQTERHDRANKTDIPELHDSTDLMGRNILVTL